MATKKTDDKAVEKQAEDTQAATTEQATETTEGKNEPAQATDQEGVRRGLGAPPPGTDGDPTVKPV